MAFRGLVPSELTELGKILETGISGMSMSMVAAYLIPRGFGWAQATGFARQIIPSFSGIAFAEHWSEPYIKHRKYVHISGRDITEQIPIEDMTEKPLKQATRYMYEVSFDILDSDGEVIDTATASYYSDDLMTPEDAADRSYSVFSEPSESVQLGAANFEFKALYHNEGWDY